MAGLPVEALNTVLAALAAVTVVAAMRVVGLPARRRAHGAAGGHRPAAGPLVPGHPRLSAVVGVASVWSGWPRPRVWGLAPGGTIVLVAAGVFVVVALASRTVRLG